MVNVALLTPAYGAALAISANPLPVFTCHWYAGVVPVTTTLKDAFSPVHALTTEGCVVMANGIQDAAPSSILVMVSVVDIRWLLALNKLDLICTAGSEYRNTSSTYHPPPEGAVLSSDANRNLILMA